MRDLLTTLGELIGVAAIAAGCATFSIGAGLIAGGFGLITVCYLASAPDVDADGGAA